MRALVAAMACLVCACLGNVDVMSPTQDDMSIVPARDMAPVVQADMVVPSNNMPKPEDMSEPQDMSTTPDVPKPPDMQEDMEAPEDMGAPDVPPPVQENPCDAGPLELPIPNCRPAPPPTTGDPAEDCVRRINQLRWECQCLPPLERWREGESCATEQAAYDADGNGPHAAFRARICSPGGRGQNECPGYGTWNRVIGTCLQQMWDEGPGEPFIEHGHYINMTNPRHTKVACGGADGWFIQNFQ